MSLSGRYRKNEMSNVETRPRGNIKVFNTIKNLITALKMLTYYSKDLTNAYKY